MKGNMTQSQLSHFESSNRNRNQVAQSSQVEEEECSQIDLASHASDDSIV